jgi:hypothetical protein
MLHYFDGDGGGVGDLIDVPMTPAAVFVGDNNNVFALWCLDQNRNSVHFTLRGAHTCRPFFHCAPESHIERILNLELGTEVNLFGEDESFDSGEPSFELAYSSKNGGPETIKVDSEEFLSGGLGLGLNVRVRDSDLKSGLMKYMFNKHDRANVTPLDLRAGLSKEPGETLTTNSLFHLDGDGKACFTEDQAERASDYIAEMNLDERVRACLQKKKFELPQVSERVSIVYCNDDR